MGAVVRQRVAAAAGGRRVSRRARARAGARPWEHLPNADGIDVDALLAQVRPAAPQEPTESRKPQGPAGSQDRRRERER